MKKTAVALASVLIIGLPALGNAAPRGNVGSTQGRGASEFSPGDQLRDSTVKPRRGASEFSPGDRMRDSTVKPRRGASEFSPGDRMNDARKH